MKSKIIFLILLFSTVTFAKLRADEPVSFQASAPPKVIIDRHFQLTYTLNTKGKDFRLPEIANFDILAGPFESFSSTTKMINGSYSSVTAYKYTYTLLPQKTGKFTIPSASVNINGQKYSSNGLTIEVLPADAPEQEQQGGQARTQQQNSAQAGNSQGSAISNENLFIRTVLSKTNVYEQEAILVTYKLYAGIDVVNFSIKNLPEYKGFMKNDVENQPELTLEHYNGRNYATAELYKTVLYPQHGGSIDIDKAEFEIIIRMQNNAGINNVFNRDLYITVPKVVTAPGAKVNVTELPTANKPAKFNGTVGTFKLNSSISASEIKANEAVTMKITIDGSGNMRMINTPTVNLPESFEMYDPKVSNEFKTSVSGVSGHKTIEYMFIPRHAGEFEIPSINFSYFDIQTKTYKILQTPLYKLNVLKGEGGNAGAVVDGGGYVSKEEVRQLGSDIRYIKTNEIVLAQEKTPMVGSLSSWLMYLIPLVVALLIFFIMSKQAKENANVGLMKNKKANKMARKRLNQAQKLLNQGNKDLFYDEVLKAVWTYLSDKLSIPVASLTKDKVESELTSSNVDSLLISQVLEILNTCEFARYAPNSGQQEMGNLFEETIQVISNLEERIKK